VTEEKKPQSQAQNQNKQGKQKKKEPKPERDAYLFYYHDKEVEVHVAYGNTVLRLTGKIKAKARYDIILDYTDDTGKKQRLIINKAYLIATRPLD